MSKKNNKKVSKKKQTKQEWHQRAVERKKAEQEKRAREEKQAKKLVRPGSGVKRKKLASEIVPVTKKTEIELDRWSNQIGQVGSTNIKERVERHCPVILTTVIFGHNCNGSLPIHYVALEEEDVYGLVPHNKGHEPQEDIRYLCKEPWHGQKPLFFTKGRPVYTTMVYPVIVKNFSEKIILLKTEDNGFAITEELLMQTGKESVLYIEDGESKYIWIKNPEYIGSIKNALQKAERRDKGASNSWLQDEKNILKAPVYALEPSKVVEIVTLTLQRKEEIFARN